MQPANEEQKQQQQQIVEAYHHPTILDDYFEPAEFYCNRCHKVRLSVTQFRFGQGTCLCSLCICVFLPVLGLLPFYIKDCQDAYHRCPECLSYVGRKVFKPC